LYVTTVFNDYFSPITSQGATRTNVYVFANDYIASNGCLWMHKRRRMDYGFKPFEFENHSFNLISRTTSPNLFNRMPSSFYFGKFSNEIRRFVLILHPINVFFYNNSFQVCSRIFFD
jgi:hypothetical protein